MQSPVYIMSVLQQYLLCIYNNIAKIVGLMKAFLAAHKA